MMSKAHTGLELSTMRNEAWLDWLAQATFRLSFVAVTLGLALWVSVGPEDSAYYRRDALSRRNESYDSLRPMAPSPQTIHEWFRRETALHEGSQMLRKHDGSSGNGKESNHFEYPLQEYPKRLEDLYAKNGFRADAGLYRKLMSELPIPLQVMERYKSQHGVDVLHRESTEQLRQRRYAVALYSCPHMAGNRLYYYLNAMLFSIVTNRTMLWRYMDYQAAGAYVWRPKEADPNPWRCESTFDPIVEQPNRTVQKLDWRSSFNTLGDCSKILRRASWIPSFEEWSVRMTAATNASLNHTNGSSHDVEGRVGVRETGEKQECLYQIPVDLKKLSMQDYTNDTIMPLLGFDNTTRYPQRIVMFPHIYTRFNLLVESWGDRLRPLMLHRQESRDTLRQLTVLGSDFLYGMLQRYSFDFSPELSGGSASAPSPAGDATAKNGNHDTMQLSIGLHSRHLYDWEDGCDISREIGCFQEVLSALLPTPSSGKTKTVFLRVGVMSDRTCTLDLVRQWFVDLHNENGGYYNGYALRVQVVVANHTTSRTGFQEHGPFAGAGYYQDLELVSQSRSAFIGSGRSSSLLVSQLIDFHRIMTIWDSHQQETSDKFPILPQCKLPAVNASLHIAG